MIFNKYVTILEVISDRNMRNETERQTMMINDPS